MAIKRLVPGNATDRKSVASIYHYKAVIFPSACAFPFLMDGKRVTTMVCQAWSWRAAATLRFRNLRVIIGDGIWERVDDGEIIIRGYRFEAMLVCMRVEMFVADD